VALPPVTVPATVGTDTGQLVSTEYVVLLHPEPLLTLRARTLTEPVAVVVVIFAPDVYANHVVPLSMLYSYSSNDAGSPPDPAVIVALTKSPLQIPVVGFAGTEDANDGTVG